MVGDDILSHTDFSLHLVSISFSHMEKQLRRTYEVTRMVLINVGSMMVLTTGHTSTTWMLSVLADTTMTGTDMASTIVEV